MRIHGLEDEDDDVMMSWCHINRYTYSNAVAEAGAWLRAGGADVVSHTRVLTGASIEVSYGARTVGPMEGSRPGLVASCWGGPGDELARGTITQLALRDKGWLWSGTHWERKCILKHFQAPVWSWTHVTLNKNGSKMVEQALLRYQEFWKSTHPLHLDQ